MLLYAARANRPRRLNMSSSLRGEPPSRKLRSAQSARARLGPLAPELSRARAV